MLGTEVVQLLREKRLSIALAESCTGGRVCDMLTDVPGCSGVLKGGVVAYSNGSKVKLLGVSPATLERFGAVSAECASEMARGARSALEADIGVSTTGIAGPAGATPTKPVGMVYIALATGSGVKVSEHHFPGDRESVRSKTAEEVLRLILRSV
ncbi:MAG: CinA family protein [Methanomassiliicoccales archaeon]|nr:CinA family protein [Methanomassiliicoccales archaeon]